MKTLYIIRGLDGTGKTTIARQLCPWWNPFSREIAADNFPDRYLPDGKLNPAISHASAHDWVKRSVEGWMKRGVRSIAVHNVFSLKRHCIPFINLAAKHGYSVSFICTERLLLPNGSEALGVHDVPADVRDVWIEQWESYVESPENKEP
jgi:predicted ABC-type ATPase